MNPYIKEKLYKNINEYKYKIIYNDLLLFIATLYVLLIDIFSEIMILSKGYFYFKKNKKNFIFNNKEIKILRIENKEGVGPYKSNHMKGEHSDKTPTPYYDFKDVWIYLLYTNKYKKYKFGFKNKEQIKNWFTEEELKILYKKGFYIKEYKTKNYYCSEHQIIFYNKW